MGGKVEWISPRKDNSKKMALLLLGIIALRLDNSVELLEVPISQGVGVRQRYLSDPPAGWLVEILVY